MLLTSPTPHGNLCFYTGVMGEDKRGELVRMRLSEDDLEKVSVIQDYLNGIGRLSSLGKVVSDAIDCYYGVLAKEGVVPPTL
jgi:hypothetical protein